MATPSIFNRPYAELAGGTGSLANRPAMPVGMGPMPASRRFAMASRQAIRDGDKLAAAELASRAQWAERIPVFGSRGGLPFLPPQPPLQAPQSMTPPLTMAVPRAATPLPMLPGPAAFNLPPGATMPDAGTAPTAPEVLSFDPLNPTMGTPLQGADTYRFPAMTVPTGSDMAALNQGAFQGAFMEAPPLVSAAAIPGTNGGYVMPIYGGKPGNTALPTGMPEPTRYAPVQGGPAGLMVPTGPGAGALPPLQEQFNPGWSVTGQPKTILTPATLAGAPLKLPEGIQYEKDRDTGRVTGGFYPARLPDGRLVIKRIDLDGDDVISPAEQAAAMQAAGQTPGGVKFSRVP